MTIKSGESEADGALKRSRLTLGHDIRSAVSDVIGGLRLVDMSSLDEQNRPHLECARTAAELLARLLDDAAVVFLGEASPPAQDRPPVSVSELLDDLAARWSARAREKGLEFRLVSAEGLQSFAALDRLSIERIVSNLLGNAIKFCDRGQVTLDASCDAEGRLSLAISDAGPGFSPEALQMLFHYEGRPSGNAKPGSGLGLYIAKEIADRLGAKLTAGNRPEGGALVTLTLPAIPMADPSGFEGLVPDLSGVDVLVADDNATSQLLLRNMLQSLGAKCVVASDGAEALRLFQHGDFDLAIMDIEMPGMTGIEAIKLIRQSETGSRRRLPIIAVTAYGLSANREVILSSGADEVVSKPIMAIDQIASAAARVLGQTSDRSVAAGPIELSSLDQATRTEIVGQLHTDLSGIADGLKAARNRRDRALVQRHCHVLVSLAGTIEATALLQEAQTLRETSKRQDWNGLETRIRKVERLLQDTLSSPFFGESAPRSLP